MLLTRGKIRDLLSFAFAAWLSQRRRRRRRHNEGESRRLRLSDILFLAAVVVCWWRAEMSQCAKHWKERALKKKKKSQIRIQARGLCCTDGVLAHCLFYNRVKKALFLSLFWYVFIEKSPNRKWIANLGCGLQGFVLVSFVVLLLVSPKLLPC